MGDYEYSEPDGGTDKKGRTYSKRKKRVKNRSTEEVDSDEDSDGYIQMRPCAESDPNRVNKAHTSGATKRVTGCYKWLALGLGCLCISVFALGSWLHLKHTLEQDQLISQKDQLMRRFQNLTLEKSQLIRCRQHLTTENSKLQAEISVLRKSIELTNLPCPIGWVYFHFKCYYLSSIEKTWLDARGACNSNQADLLVISDMEEDIFIDKFNQTGWIGLQRTQNNWKWVDDTLLFRGYWRRPLPNNTVGDCVRTIPDFTNSASGWKASLCDSELFFYCEKSQL